MSVPIVLASGSTVRAEMLLNAGVPFSTEVARIDEDAIKQSLLAEAATPRDVADTLAEMKARKVSERLPGRMIVGCDQVLQLGEGILSKADTREIALEQLLAMQGHKHSLFSAAVVYENGEPLWRHIGRVDMTMRVLSRPYLEDYVTRNWESIRETVGNYKVEEEGVRLFARIDGDYFSVLGMPLMQLLEFLIRRGVLPS